MKLTKRKALELCRDLWAWLARNPKKDKSEWPEWKKIGTMANHCPCCHYAKARCAAREQRTGICQYFCDFCSLRSHWPKDCVDWNTDFMRWRSGRGKSENARIIANAARRELRKLNAK